MKGMAIERADTTGMNETVLDSNAYDGMDYFGTNAC